MDSRDSMFRLAPDLLRATVDPGRLPFATTSDIEPFRGVLGQDRALEALAFGVAMGRPGYNLYVMGEPGTGRLSLVTDYLSHQAAAAATPSDLLYIKNFDEPLQPLPLVLPAGLGKTFVRDVEVFVDGLLTTFPSAFENPSYQRQKAELERGFNQKYNRAIDTVEDRARSVNIALFRDGETITFMPMLGDAPASEEEFAAFPEQDKQSFHEHAGELEQYLADMLMELPQWRRESGDRLRELNQRTIAQALEPLFTPLRKHYGQHAAVADYLDTLQGRLPRLVFDQFALAAAGEAREEAAKRAQLLMEFVPKLLVTHGSNLGAPVVYETNPSYTNLFGRVEYLNDQGTLITHHGLICAGALHQANGGYLILDADKLVTEPHVWDALKRALKRRVIRIEPPFQDPSAPAVVGLTPQAVTLDLKIVLIGDRELYYVLQELDDEFNELFRVLVDFEGHIPRNDETVVQLVGLLKAQSELAGCRPMSAAAIARLIEHSSRMAEHQARLSVRIGDMLVVVAEAEHICRQEGASAIADRHVDAALAFGQRRQGRISQRLLEEVLEGTVLIDTDGASVGKINGLTVIEVGGSRFGSPARITATVFPGARGIVDIEREVQLGQAIHSKGVMILAGYLGQRYARDLPLGISANLALEQSYGYVDGDSASLAEVCALISAITGVPIRQSVAVTGSINQYGDVQTVGGVNEKIEGFFQLCQARGLRDGQGVLIPKSNAVNLMLSADVVDAARRGLFSIYAVESVDEALAVMTGLSAARVNGLARTRLRRMAERSIGVLGERRRDSTR